jgi:hypothetical protein
VDEMDTNKNTSGSTYIQHHTNRRKFKVKLPTISRDEKQSRAEAERRGRLEERRSEEKE